ncbi:MAG: TonB-dependent receptor [Proteobacteria bacterium]|nr:TonB-dependent receptor [Pseudomonadota bacterium]HQR05038.1 TonB-dependent receptor [Rhodocyclaceae bacterium]
MQSPSHCRACGIVLALSCLASPALADQTTILEEITIVAQRLDAARNALSPKTGGSLYRFSADDVSSLPQGGNTGFNQVLLQAPGVVDDADGQLHVRGDHGNLQYRINGVILPDGIGGFGSTLDTRFAKRIDLMTGALPAQYGFRTAGVVEIETKSQFDGGGRIDYYGGSQGTSHPGFEYGNSTGPWSYYLTGSRLRTDLGLENPTPAYSARHDRSEQEKLFGYLAYVVSPTTRISAMLSSYSGSFQIPVRAGLPVTPNAAAYLGSAALPVSATLDDRQRETNQYGVLALQSRTGGGMDYQVALFSRYSQARFTPDANDLLFADAATRLLRSSLSNGLQADASYAWDTAHTLRMGLFARHETTRSENAATVFAVDAQGDYLPGSLPLAVTASAPRQGNRLWGSYLQDEWQATPALTVNYGARFDSMDADVSASQFSPRLGLVYKAGAHTTVHAAYARYFTPPPTERISSATVTQFLGTSALPDPSNSRNDPVQPERSHYLDFGISHTPDEHLTLGADIFYKRITNLLDDGQFGSAPLFTPFNYAEGKIYGVELSIAYRTEKLSTYANLTHTISLGRNIVSGQFNLDPATLAYAANHWIHTDHDQNWTASAGVAYAWRGATLSANAIFGSGLRNGNFNTDHLPAYTQVDAGISRIWHSAALGAFETRLAVVNLFDKSYALRDGSGIGVFAPQYGPRRGWFAGLAKLF